MMNLLVLVAMGGLSTAGTLDDTPKKDADALQGAWRAVSIMAEGQAMPEEQARAFELVIKGDKYDFKVQGEVMESGTLKLDSSKKPATVDFMIEKGDDKGKTQLGIYELKGDDFKCCVSQAGKTDRPKELKAGSDSTLFVFKRQK
jgi:uncharacterized protein (TIGR03067 family)